MINTLSSPTLIFIGGLEGSWGRGIVPGITVAGRYLLLERMGYLRAPLPASVHLLNSKGLGFEVAPYQTQDKYKEGLRSNSGAVENAIYQNREALSRVSDAASALVLKPSSVLSAVLTFKPTLKKRSHHNHEESGGRGVPMVDHAARNSGEGQSLGHSGWRHQPSDKYDLSERIGRGSHGEVSEP